MSILDSKPREVRQTPIPMAIMPTNSGQPNQEKIVLIFKTNYLATNKIPDFFTVSGLS